MSKPTEMIDSNAKTQPSNQRLSSKGGTVLLRSVSLFLAGGRKASRSAGPAQSSAAKKCDKRRKMIDEGSSQNLNKCTSKMMETLRKETHFSKDEIEALYKIYGKLIQNNQIQIHMTTGAMSATISKTNKIHEGIDRTVFQELLHNTFDLVIEDSLMDRIFYTWDRANEGLLKPEVWIKGLSIFLRGTFEEKVSYCFNVYDLNGDGYISRDEMFLMLKDSLVKQPQEEDPDEGVKDLVEIVLRKLDVDKDGKVSFQDYETSVHSEPLLLEAFGQCLPSESACVTFLSTL